MVNQMTNQVSEWSVAAVAATIEITTKEQKAARLLLEQAKLDAAKLKRSKWVLTNSIGSIKYSYDTLAEAMDAAQYVEV